jgi:DNA transposition AAA+ family ATPase
MSLTPGKTEFSAEDHLQIRTAVEAAKVNDGVTEADIARQSEIAPSSLNQYLKGKYPAAAGNNEMAAKLTKWLGERERLAEARVRTPKAPPFLPLKGAAAIMAMLQYARDVGRIVVVCGAPGVQKTQSALHFCATNNRAWYLAVDESITGTPDLMREMLMSMGEGEVGKGSPTQLMRRLCQRAGEARGVFVIDEAHKLSNRSIELLRAINDRVRCGIGMFGNTEAYAKIGPTATQQYFAQVSSRVARRKFIEAPYQVDAEALGQAWAETNGERLGPREAEFCKVIALRPGGLRNIEMTMEGALLAAFGEGAPLELRHLKGAFDGLAGAA